MPKAKEPSFSVRMIFEIRLTSHEVLFLMFLLL